MSTLLDSLRWGPDTHVVTPFGDHVWLKECFVYGRRMGVTDCCSFAQPCEWHAAIAKSQAPEKVPQ